MLYIQYQVPTQLQNRDFITDGFTHIVGCGNQLNFELLAEVRFTLSSNFQTLLQNIKTITKTDYMPVFHCWTTAIFLDTIYRVQKEYRGPAWPSLCDVTKLYRFFLQQKGLYQLSLNSGGQSKIISTLHESINAILHTSQSHRSLLWEQNMLQTEVV